MQSTASAPAQAAPSRSKPARRIAVKKPGKLCAGQMQRPGRLMPESEISRASAPGSPQLPEQLPAGGGKWTWVNFWAAWCVPCKEEIPRLKSWETKLNQLGIPFRLVFVTLDDDARQLNQFLKGQRAGGLRATYWLHDGEQREEWFKSIEMDGDPQLPAHLLVDQQGKLRCVIDGAVEDNDYDQVVALLRG